MTFAGGLFLTLMVLAATWLAYYGMVKDAQREAAQELLELRKATGTAEDLRHVRKIT